MSPQFAALSVYALLFAVFTLLVGRALRVHGGTFLKHSFQAQPEVSRAVQFLLDLGFYLLCLALLLWNLGTPPSAGFQSDPENPGAMISLFGWSNAAQSVALRLGISIFVVAAFHSLNILVLPILNRKSAESQVP